MKPTDRLIVSCSSWDDFRDRARKLSEGEEGIAFERLTQLYLKTAPEYRTKLQDVWLLRDVPVDVRRRLNLAGPRDKGIDLIADTRQGKCWAKQAKFRSQPDKPLNRTALSTFTSLAFHTCDNISLAVDLHTATKPVGKRHLMPNRVEIGLDRWRSLGQEGWALIVLRLKGRSARPPPRGPRPHQRDAISAAKRHFIAHKAAPGLALRPYFRRYSDDAVDVCDMLSNFSPHGKATLDETSKVLALPGKRDDIDGSQVKALINAGRIEVVTDYGKNDELNPYLIWLRHELLRGALTFSNGRGTKRKRGSSCRGFA
jgi:hypothetical protein